MHVALIGNDPTPDKLHRRLAFSEVCAWRDAALADASLLNLLCRWAVEQEEQIAFNAAWILSHLPACALHRISPWQYQMVQKAQSTDSPAVRRLLLTLCLSQPLEQYKSADTSFFDWCLSVLTNPAEQVAIRSLCIKHACNCAAHYPELRSELYLILESLVDTAVSPAVLSAARNTMRKIRRMKQY